jgi:precorrin-2 dehydrogenase/sirohydrochlorin ferrochelatase
MRYYPIGLDILDRRCLVVGGGEVGQRKAERLLECGARVTVVGRELTPGLEGLVREGRIGHIAADYAEDHLEGAFLVIGATDDRAVNDRIFRDARRRRVLANIVDAPGRCDFILPALCRQGELVITVATGGRSPALAKKLRQELEERYGPEYETLLKIMARCAAGSSSEGKGPTRTAGSSRPWWIPTSWSGSAKGTEKGRGGREAAGGRRRRSLRDPAGGGGAKARQKRGQGTMMDTLFFKAALAAYFLATAGYLVSLVARRVVMAKIATWVLGLAVVLHGVHFLEMYTERGFNVAVNLFEAVSLFAWIVSGAYLAVQARTKTRVLGPSWRPSPCCS